MANTPFPPPHKGRGAFTNKSGRYERFAAEAFDDGWDREEESSAPRTEVFVEKVRRILTYNDSPDIGFDRSINPYRGCEHGCSYCYARPNHAYAGLSPGLDFETKIFVKKGAAEALRAELSAPGYAPRPIMISGVTDLYQPLEKTHGLTRAILEVLAEFKHPFSFITKSALPLRDLDLLGPMGRAGLCRAAISLTTLDRDLCRKLEPRAAAPHRRLETIRALTAAGVPTMAMVAPIIPALTDHELEAILKAAAQAGAIAAGYVLLRLPHEIKDLFREWLAAHAPGRAKHVLSLIQQAHAGRDYRSQWAVRQRGDGPYASLIAARFAAAQKRLGLNQPPPELDCRQFKPPPKPGEQLPLL